MSNLKRFMTEAGKPSLLQFSSMNSFLKPSVDIRKHVVTDEVNLKLTPLCFFRGNSRGCCQTKLMWQSIGPYCDSSEVPFAFCFISAEISIHHCMDQTSLLQV